MSAVLLSLLLGIRPKHINTRFLSFKLRGLEVKNYARIVIWFFGKYRLAASIMLFVNRVCVIQKRSGTKFLVSYLKECTRLVVLFLFGMKREDSKV